MLSAHGYLVKAYYAQPIATGFSCYTTSPLIDTSRWTVTGARALNRAEIAAIYGIPAHLLGDT